MGIVNSPDPEDPEVREKLGEMATSKREAAPLYAELYRNWYGMYPEEDDVNLE